MLPKEALSQIEVCQAQDRVYPCDMTERLFHSLARLWSVKNNLTSPYLSVTVNLPENSSTLPVP